MSANHFDVFQLPILADGRVQYHVTFQPQWKGLPRINRSDLMLKNSFANPLGNWSAKLWQGDRT